MIPEAKIDRPREENSFKKEEKGCVSVVIPNFNHATYLPAAINSVLNQKYTNFEIIVVDDGSTDHSREVIEGFGDQISAIFQKNQGLSAARNSGIRAARGEFVAVLDADDLYEPNFLTTLVPLLEQNPHAAAVTCGYRFVDEQNRPLPQIEARQIPADNLFETLACGNFLVPESILVRRSTYKKVGLFDPHLRACEDLDVWLRIARNYPILISTAVLTRHRVLAGSMSTDPERMHTNRLKVLQTHLGGVNGRDFNKPANRFALGRAYLTSTIEFLQAGDPSKAYRQFRTAVANDPQLLRRQDTYYELMLGPQPKGRRGEFASVDTDANYMMASRFLKLLIHNAGDSIHQTVTKEELWANLNLTAGLITYGQGKGWPTLRYFAKAVGQRPTYLFKGPLFSRALKTILGMGRLKKLLNS